jgi:hypothetical protein
VLVMRKDSAYPSTGLRRNTTNLHVGLGIKTRWNCFPRTRQKC